MAQDASPIGRGGVGREAMAGGDAGLEMVVAHFVAMGGGAEMDEAVVDQGLIPLGAILVVEPEEISVGIDASGETRAAQEHKGEQGVAARLAAGRMRNEEGR